MTYNRPKEPITSLSKYEIHTMSSNYQVNKETVKQKDMNPLECNAITDGSCSPSPSKGAHGW